jgi:hypothetical protein
VLTSLIVGVITNKLAPAPFDSFVIEWMKKTTRTRNKQHLAAKIIQVAWREMRKVKAERRIIPDDYVGVQLHNMVHHRICYHPPPHRLVCLFIFTKYVMRRVRMEEWYVQRH